LDTLLRTPQSRIVTVSSHAHRIGTIHFDDLQLAQNYNSWASYCQSKLANLLFAFELDRKLKAANQSTISVACHPGYAATNLQFVGAQMTGEHTGSKAPGNCSG
jgi:NAD(P)-dependent dehydrogenase (short-subunit alcohol dehydrogenase family)